MTLVPHESPASAISSDTSAISSSDRTTDTIRHDRTTDNPFNDAAATDYSATEILRDMGYEDVIVFQDFSYDTALTGVTTDGRAVYDYDLMVEWLICHEGFTEEEAVEWIDYNTIRSLPYFEDADCGVFAPERP